MKVLGGVRYTEHWFSAGMQLRSASPRQAWPRSVMLWRRAQMMSKIPATIEPRLATWALLMPQ